ncbi:hypothetical protein NP493_1670g00027 [Ridgeia piscesae]|uniref:Leishmanolysin-like peptidase n=1 Tax=Ridgeia piscesae TaxID=27915 RepID=A0AAD9N9L2_RIDPI|nr:hypothetical protein NP493_1670g00027 [Ridgeia piscesae]
MCVLHVSVCAVGPFTHMEGVDVADVPKYGGSVRLADYCPFTQPYMEKSSSRTSQCAFIDNKVEDKFNYLREAFGYSSICLRHKGTWSLQLVGKGQKLYPRRYGAGCYRVECGSKESDGFVVYVDNTTYKCHTEDQELTVSSLVRQRVHTGVLVCPSYREACMKRTVLHYYADDQKEVIPKYKGTSGVSSWSVSLTLGVATVTFQVIWSHHL